MIEFRGLLYDGLTTARTPVRVTAGEHDLAIDDGSGTRRSVRRTDVAADAPVPGVPRTLRLPGGEAIETNDRAAIVQLWPTPSSLARFAFALESRWTTVLASIGATAALAWLVVAVVLPLAAEPVAYMVSADIERVMGEQVLAALDESIMRPTQLSDEEQDAVQTKLDRYLDKEPGAKDYRIELRKAGSPNALALPGGIIVLTDEMLAAIKSDDELFAVVAHELGHLRGRHATRLVLQDSGVAVLMTALAGDAVGITILAAAMPSLLVRTSYSRQFETEADDYAFASLKRHGRSPQAFADLMRRLSKERDTPMRNEGVLRYLSTHPATEERIRRAEQAR